MSPAGGTRVVAEMNKDEANRRIQELLVEMRSIVDVIRDIAVGHDIEKVEFLGAEIEFGVDFERSWAYERDSIGYVPAVGGPIIDPDYWRPSSWYCHKVGKERMVWLYGPDEDTWPDSAYDQDE